MNFEQPFSPQEKQLISYCFDLSDLKTKEKNIIFHALFDYFEAYPILKITLDDIIHHSDLPIKITSQKMDDDSVHAYQDGNNVVFNKKFFDKHLICYKDCSRNGTFIKKTSEKRAPRSYEYIQR